MAKKLEVFEIPSRVYFGPNAIQKLPELVHEHSSRGITLILSGKQNSRKYAETVLEELKDVEHSLEPVLYSDVEQILDLYERYRNRKVATVVCIGGGKVIDVGKALAYFLNVPLISVPTTASHDGIASPYVSYLLQLDLSRRGFSKIYKVPYAIVADTSIICRAPRRYLLSGIGEIVGKIVAVKDWELAHRVKGEEFSEFAARLSLSSYEIVMRNVEKLKVADEQSARLVVKALIGCGVAMSIAGSSRPCSGSEHMFCHALDLILREKGREPALHGEQVALGTIMMAYLHGLNWRKIKKVLKQLGVPTTAQELGLDRDVVIEALVNAHKVRPDRYTILGSDGLTRKAAENLVEVTGVA